MLTGKVKNRTLHKNREGCGTQNRSTDNRGGHPPKGKCPRSFAANVLELLNRVPTFWRPCWNTIPLHASLYPPSPPFLIRNTTVVVIKPELKTATRTNLIWPGSCSLWTRRFT